MARDKAQVRAIQCRFGTTIHISSEGNLGLQDCKVPGENVIDSHNLQVPNGILPGKSRSRASMASNYHAVGEPHSDPGHSRRKGHT